MHFNSGGRTPGSKLPASPPPLPRPDGLGNPWPCACAHGPKKTQRPSQHLSLNNDRHANHNRDIDHLVNVMQLRREGAATVGSRLSHRRLHLCNLLTCTNEAKRQRAATVGFQLSFPRLHLWNLPDMHVNQHRRAATVGSQPSSPHQHPRTSAMWD